MAAVCLIITAALVPFIAGASSCGHDCAACHTITKQEAESLLKKQEGIKVMSVTNAPVQGLWQVSVEKEGEKSALYIDYAKKNILSGNITITGLNGKAASSQGLREKVYSADLSSLDFQNAILLGSKDAKKRIAVFTDPTCPHCVMFHDEIRKIVARNKDIAFYLFLYTLDPSSQVTAKSIACEKQKPLQVLEDAYHGKTLPVALCNTTVLDANIAYAKKNLIMSTPTIIWPNGSIHFGAISAAEFLTLLSQNSLPGK